MIVIVNAYFNNALISDMIRSVFLFKTSAQEFVLFSY